MAAAVDGDEDARCGALPYRRGHRGRDFAEQRVGYDDGDGADYHVGAAAADLDGVLAGRGAVRAGLEHRGGGGAVRPDRGDVGLGEGRLDRLHDLASYAAALSVYYENFHESFTSCKSLPLRRYFSREA